MARQLNNQLGDETVRSPYGDPCAVIAPKGSPAKRTRVRSPMTVLVLLIGLLSAPTATSASPASTNEAGPRDGRAAAARNTSGSAGAGIQASWETGIISISGTQHWFWNKPTH